MLFNKNIVILVLNKEKVIGATSRYPGWNHSLLTFSIRKWIRK